MKAKLERITHFKPAFDKRSDDPKKDYGIGTLSCIMIVKGPKGAVHFSFSTGVLLESTMENYIDTGRAKYEKHQWGYHYLNKPMGYDVGYHSPKPMYEDQQVCRPTKMVKTGNGTLDVSFENVGTIPNCEWIGVPCYTDGSAMRADDWFKILTEKGSNAIWPMLEEEYYEVFAK